MSWLFGNVNTDNRWVRSAWGSRLNYCNFHQYTYIGNWGGLTPPLCFTVFSFFSYFSLACVMITSFDPHHAQLYWNGSRKYLNIIKYSSVFTFTKFSWGKHKTQTHTHKYGHAAIIDAAKKKSSPNCMYSSARAARSVRENDLLATKLDGGRKLHTDLLVVIQWTRIHFPRASANEQNAKHNRCCQRELSELPKLNRNCYSTCCQTTKIYYDSIFSNERESECVSAVRGETSIQRGRGEKCENNSNNNRTHRSTVRRSRIEPITKILSRSLLFWHTHTHTPTEILFGASLGNTLRSHIHTNINICSVWKI